MSKKQRNHNEWFRSVSLRGRKSCPSCKEKLQPGEKIWSWGEYVHGKWRTVDHFCKSCFQENVKSRLTGHSVDCGCSITLVGYGGGELPEWLTLLSPEDEERIVKSLARTWDYIADDFLQAAGGSCSIEDSYEATADHLSMIDKEASRMFFNLHCQEQVRLLKQAFPPVSGFVS